MFNAATAPISATGDAVDYARFLNSGKVDMSGYLDIYKEGDHVMIEGWCTQQSGANSYSSRMQGVSYASASINGFIMYGVGGGNIPAGSDIKLYAKD